MDIVSEQMPRYGPKDIAVVVRNDTVELYAHREFAAKTLLLSPHTTEIKDKFFTHGRSVLLKARGTSNDRLCM